MEGYQDDDCLIGELEVALKVRESVVLRGKLEMARLIS